MEKFRPINSEHWCDSTDYLDTSDLCEEVARTFVNCQYYHSIE